MIPLQRLDSSGERKQEISCAMIGNILRDSLDDGTAETLSLRVTRVLGNISRYISAAAMSGLLPWPG